MMMFEKLNALLAQFELMLVTEDVELIHVSFTKPSDIMAELRIDGLKLIVWIMDQKVRIRFLNENRNIALQTSWRAIDEAILKSFIATLVDQVAKEYRYEFEVTEQI